MFRSRAIPWAWGSLIAGMAAQVAFGSAYLHAAAAVAGLLLAVGFVGLGVATITRPVTAE